MNEYFEASVRQHLDRGQRLLARIPRNLPREFHLLAQTCEKELTDVLNELESLLEDPKMRLANYQPERLRRFRRSVALMGFLETRAIAALQRHDEDDAFLNRLIDHIRQEIAYPLLPPVVTSLSQEYFHIYPDLNLLFVPLSEGDFLLHLPDLYHELGHPLILKRHHLSIQPFQDALFCAFAKVLEYVNEERKKEERRQGPQQIRFYLRLWEKSWRDWIIEFFCDLFATYTAGPAFVWAHFHLCVKLGEDQFRVPRLNLSTHPANAARMEAMLHGLRIAGFVHEARAIQSRWEELVRLSGGKPEPEYRRCFPDSLLRALSQDAFEGVRAMGCNVATPDKTDPVYTLLNQAWAEFWLNPERYSSWEREAGRRLRSICS